MSFQRLLELKFSDMDRNNDGFLTSPEVQKLAFALGLHDSSIAEFMQYCDRDKDGKVSRQEFEEAQKRRKAKRLSQYEVHTVYQRLDSAGQGRLNYEAFLAHVKPLNKHWSEAELKRLFKKYAKANKNYLTMEEFDQLVREST